MAITLSRDRQHPRAGPVSGRASGENPSLIVEFKPDDTINPMNLSLPRNGHVTSVVTASVLAFTLTSSVYYSSSQSIRKQFNISHEVFSLWAALYVLKFTVRPVFWALISEMYGRQMLFIITLVCVTLAQRPAVLI